MLDYRPSYLVAIGVSLAVLLLYIATLAPSTAMWDASEYTTAAYTLGIPHPPGNPLFVLIGRVFALLPISPSIGFRINMVPAISSAISAGMWFLIVERVLVSWFPQRWQRIVGGCVAAVLSSTAYTVWHQSLTNEHVYMISLLGMAVISWLMIRWSDDPDGLAADRILVLVAYLLGLGYSNHMAGMLAAPAVGVAVLVRRPRTLRRWRLLLAGFAALLLGLTPFATQPIRAALNPPINEGDPTACREGLSASCTFSKGTYDAFKYNFNRGQYGKPAVTERQAPIDAQIGMWWLYFNWQWLRDAHGERPGTQALLGWIFFGLGLYGAYVHYRRDRRSFWYFGSLMFTITLVLIYYLNFKYGASQSPELGDAVPREVRDRDYFYLWSFAAWGVWAALGLVAVWEQVAARIGADQVRLGGETVEVPRTRSWLITSPILAIAFVPLFNWHLASRAGQTDTRDFAHDLLNSVEPYGVLITVGDNDTFPLWYAQEVEGIRKDVVVANTSLLNTDWYVRQLIRRPVYEYDAAKGPAVYRNRQWPKPSGPPLKMTLAEADAIPLYAPLQGPAVFKKASLVAVVDPTKLTQDGNGVGFLQRADIVVLHIINDSWPERPVYFSRTTANYADQLGMGRNVLLQGLASKLFIPPQASGRDTILASGSWIDVPRTTTLWRDVFWAPKSMAKRKDGWVDRPSVGIPYLYLSTGMLVSQLEESRGNIAAAQDAYETTLRVASAVRLDDIVKARAPRPRPVAGDTAPAATLPFVRSPNAGQRDHP